MDLKKVIAQTDVLSPVSALALIIGLRGAMNELGTKPSPEVAAFVERIADLSEAFVDALAYAEIG